MTEALRQVEVIDTGTLQMKFTNFLATNSIFTIEELTSVLGAAPDVVRTVVSRYRQRSGVQIDSLTRRDGVKIYYIVPQEADDVTGFFLRKVRELGKYDIAVTRTALSDRVNLMLTLGVVQNDSNLATVLRNLSDGDVKTMAELAAACGRTTMNMPVLFRKVLSKLPLFGLELTSQVSGQYEPGRKKGQAQKEYGLKRLSLGLDDCFDEFRGRFVSIAQSILKDPAEAEEVANQVEIHMFEKDNEGTLPPMINYPAYIAKAVHNAALNTVRDTKRHREIIRKDSATIPIGSVEGPESASINRNRTEVMRRVIEALNPDHSKVIELFYFQGMTTGQIAEETRVELGTVLSRLHRARKNLKESLESQGITGAFDL